MLPYESGRRRKKMKEEKLLVLVVSKDEDAGRHKQRTERWKNVGRQTKYTSQVGKIIKEIWLTNMWKRLKQTIPLCINAHEKRGI